MDERIPMTAIKDDFKCQRCGRCCLKLQGSLFLTEEEVEKWSKKIVKSNYGKYPAIKFASILPGIGTADLFSTLKKTESYTDAPFSENCQTNKEKYKCMIQEIKPQVCREFPFKENGEVRNDEGARICPEVRRLYNQGKD